MNAGSPAMTGPPAPGDQPPGNGQVRYASGAGHPGGDPLEAQRARLASFWALVLRRFRAYAQRGSAAADRDCQKEDR
jgi:hypothetical protein